ncbi:MAG: PTS glucose transporter subunit IIA, partial [Butyricicoccus sp.]
YTPHCTTGDKVNAGDTLLTFDIEAIRAAGYDVITPVLVCNADDFKEITIASGSVQASEPLLTLKK